MEDKLKDKTVQTRATSTEANPLAPTEFEVSFYADCRVGVRVAASTKAEAIAKVHAMLSEWDKQCEEDAEETSGASWFEDKQTVNLYVDDVFPRQRKGMSAWQIDPTDVGIRDGIFASNVLSHEDGLPEKGAKVLNPSNQSSAAGTEVER